MPPEAALNVPSASMGPALDGGLWGPAALSGTEGRPKPGVTTGVPPPPRHTTGVAGRDEAGWGSDSPRRDFELDSVEEGYRGASPLGSGERDARPRSGEEDSEDPDGEADRRTDSRPARASCKTHICRL